MKSCKLLTSLLLIGFLACPFPAIAAENTHEIHGSVFFGGTGFDYSEDEVHHLERYGTNREGGNDNGGHIFFDVFDADLSIVNTEDDSHTIDISRDAFNYFDQRVEGRMNTDELKIKFRSTILESHIQDPVPESDPTWSAASGGSGNTLYLSQFNNDSNLDAVFSIERDSYEGSITIKPAAYGHDGSIIGDLEIYYRGYNRDGKRLFRYVVSGGAALTHTARWRGIDQRVDENMEIAGVRSVFAPFHWFTLTNDTSIEFFDNHAAPVGLTDINFLFDSNINGRRHTVNFIADTEKITTTSEAHTSIGEWLELRGGYTFMELEQETFSHVIRDGTSSTDNETTRNYLTGRTDYHVATASGALLLAEWWTLNVHGRWELRDNRSSIGDSTGWHTLATIRDPRIDEISTIEGTVETTFRLPTMRTTLNGGWTRKRTNRDLQFGTGGGISSSTEFNLQGYTLYTSNTTQDVFFLNVTTHPAPGWTARFKGSATTASDTGLITENDVGFAGKATISYYAPVLHGFNVSAHGQIKDFENDEFAYQDVDDGSTFRMDHDSLVTNGGLSASINPTESTSLFATYTYISNELDTTFIRTNLRKFKETAGSNVIFRREQLLAYDDRSHSFSGGATQRLTDWWMVSASGVFTFSEGQNASSSLAEVLGRADNEIEHLDYVVSGSTEISLGDGWGVAGEASHERFEDEIDSNNNGHINMFMASVFFTR